VVVLVKAVYEGDEFLQLAHGFCLTSVVRAHAGRWFYCTRFYSVMQ
jgi:hypothetical protein